MFYLDGVMIVTNFKFLDTKLRTNLFFEHYGAAQVQCSDFYSFDEMLYNTADHDK